MGSTSFLSRDLICLSNTIGIRECRIRVTRPGFHTKVLILATTPLDAKRYPKKDLAELYRARWNAELDLRSLKTTMQMDLLYCKTSELVRKEIWTHLLAYNLIRTVMAQAAAKHDALPQAISFKVTFVAVPAYRLRVELRRSFASLEPMRGDR